MSEVRQIVLRGRSLSERTIARLKAQYGYRPPIGRKIHPEPFKLWPWWAKALGILRRKSDKGVGDTFHRITGKAGTWYERTYRRMKKKRCGCRSRRNRWNRLYPYHSQSTA